MNVYFNDILNKLTLKINCVLYDIICVYSTVLVVFLREEICNVIDAVWKDTVLNYSVSYF